MGRLSRYRLLRLEHLTVVRPVDQERARKIAQVAEEGLRAAREQGGPLWEAVLEALAEARADLERRPGWSGGRGEQSRRPRASNRACCTAA